MSEKITPRSQDFPKWYQDIVIQAKLADYSPVKGCMVIRPNGYAIWEHIQSELNTRIKKKHVRNAYFPLFIPESFLKKEAEHVEGFAPQCAVVTYAGAKDLEEKLVIRPTSETIINSMFAKWIQSYRDLPFLINQWANVVRWEMRTRLFLRTTEFLWQEGHTCHATLDEAEDFSRKILKMYQEFSENVLAMPVWAGLKTDSERFAGALRTYSIEAMMQDGKALQAGTSHNLSDHFAKAFGTKFLDRDNVEKNVFQTSWGVSTRLIGGMIMTHSDDKGLVLPPKLAETPVVIVPILGNDEKVNDKLKNACKTLAQSIMEQDPSVNVKIDDDPHKKPGWKFHEMELIGIPIRIELGPRDLEAQKAVFVRRDLGEKVNISLTDCSARVVKELIQMQKDLLVSAQKRMSAQTFETSDYGDFLKRIEGGGFFKVGWCQNPGCEAKLKEETKATIRCIVIDSIFNPVLSNKPCLVCKTTTKSFEVIVARSY